MENKKFYVTIKGKQVEVTEEVYREYIRFMRVERSRRLRAWKCKIVGPKGNLIRCPNRCSECAYARAGMNPTGNNLSLDEFKECGVEIEDKLLDLERDIIEAEECLEKEQTLHKAIQQLMPRQQEIVRMIYFEGKTQEEVAFLYGVDGSAIRHAMQRVYARLKKFLEKNKKI